MKPIEIKPEIRVMSHEELTARLEYLSFEFCINADFQKIDAVNKLVARLEEYSMEALMRVMEGKLGYRPLQNKIYEKVEGLFDNQDSYNINRMFSSMRRTHYFGVIDPEDKKYIEWFKNRVKYGVKSLIREVHTVSYVTVPKFEELVYE